VIARVSYPRPILAVATGGIDGSRAPHYVTEPLSVIARDEPAGRTVEDALERHGIPPTQLRGFRPGGIYYPSPGGLQEEVRALLVEIDPVAATPNHLRAIDALELLRAAQVGGLPDARLELNVYELLAQLGRDPGPWIGETLALGEAESVEPTTLGALRQRPARRRFERIAESRDFLELVCMRFDELDATGRAVASRTLEFVRPKPLSSLTVVTAPLLRREAEIYFGVDDDDLPAAQSFNGNSQLLVAPAWRLPHAVTSIRAARAWILERLAVDYGLSWGETWDLGGRYHPSPGATPEVVYPMAVEVLAPGHKLHWVTLRELAHERSDLVDGHLRIVALRAAHALGMGWAAKPD
jgi:hypothetical protein